MFKTMKRALAMLLALIMALGATAAFAETGSNAGEGQMTLEALEALNGGAAKVYTHDGRVTFVEGACTDEPVTSMEDAARVVADMITLLGGDGRTRFEPWRTLTDTSGNRYYVFQQMYSGVTVSGGAVKVVTDAEGRMLGLVSSVEVELPETEVSEGIAAEAAEALVLKHYQDAEKAAPELLEGRTDKVVLPVNLDIDMESEIEKEESRFVWVVYTNNPSASITGSSELPYLAHYVDLSGEYLYSLPTVMPGDEVSEAGYDAAYVFEFMEPAEYTGNVTLADGSEMEITIQLMRDSRTGMYYLGNLERRIAVADCYDFLYDKGRVVLEASKDNTGWDNTCLLSLYNYCRAWDYYRAIGWVGGDGLGTPILILKDYCDKDHEPIDNAAYAGRYYGWQLFLSSSVNQFSQCLDVLAHEFTHCVTHSVMTYNAYKNDYGAINEAMSDIQGNICDHMYQERGEKYDPEWLLGEDIDQTIRSMSDPQEYGQPRYAWDIYYVPKVKDPTELNDRGGVHANSSLLNNVAWRLCEKEGMTLEEARAYWFAVDCAMVPGTDYAQLSELMPWVLKNLGLEKYASGLEAAMDATRLRTDEMPEAFDDDRALVTMTLPDTEQFTDGNWALYILSVNLNGAIQRAIDIVEGNPGYENSLDELASILAPEGGVKREDVPNRIVNMLAAYFTEPDETAKAATAGEAAAEAEISVDDAADPGKDLMLKALYDWARKYFGDMLYSGMGAAGQDGRTVRMVCRPGQTVPVMLRLELKPNSMQPKTAGLAVYCGRWFDVGGIVRDVLLNGKTAEQSESDMPDLGFLNGMLDSIMAEAEKDEATRAEDGEQLEALPTLSLEEVRAILTGVQDAMKRWAWLTRMFLFEIKPGQICEIRADGLEKTTVLDEETMDKLMDDVAALMEGTAEGAQTPDEESAPTDEGAQIADAA